MAKKFIGQKTTAARKNTYHLNPECSRLKSPPREATPSELAYHEMTVCALCRRWAKAQPPTREEVVT